MPVVTETFVLPGGIATPIITAVVELAGEGGAPFAAAYGSDPEATTVGSYRVPVVPDMDSDPATATWSIELVGNETMTPLGTVWRIVLEGEGISSMARYIVVPATGGPYDVVDLLTSAPGEISTPGLTLHAALRGPGGHLPNGPVLERDIPMVDDEGNVVWSLLALVATTGDYADLDGLPTLGTAAAADVEDFDPAGAADVVASAVASEASTRASADTALDGRLDTIEAVGPLASAASVAAEAGTRAAADTALDGRLDAIEGLGDLATQAELDAEAVLARNASNLSSGVVNDARIPAGIARDTEVADAVLAEVTARDAAIAAAIGTLTASAPALLDTLAEIDAAIGNDPNFATTMTTALAGKQASSTELSILAALSSTTIGRNVLTAANAGAVRTLLSLVIGADVQAWSAVLDATTAAFTTALATKLGGIATGATANSTDAFLLDRTNHTSTQAQSTVTGLVAALAAKADTSSLGTAAALNSGTGAGNLPTVTQADARYQRLLLVTAVKTGAYAAAANEFVPLDTTGGTFAVTLPAAPVDGTAITVKWVIGGAAPTVVTSGSDVLNVAAGATTATLSVLNQAITFTYKTSAAIWYLETSLSLGGLDGRFAPNIPVTTTIVSNASPTVNVGSADHHVTITALATAITSMTTNLSGSPNNFQRLIYRIKDDGTARAITWGATFVSRGATLPTTTVAGKLLTVGFLWNSVTGTYGCVAVAQEA